MRTYLLSILSLLFVTSLFAQAPQSINYQAAARTSTGELLTDQEVSLRISVLSGNINGTPVYTETHNARTNDLGLFNLAIGNGTPESGTMSSIDWGADRHFLQIELDANGGSDFVLIGTSQLLSVPYALYAEKTAPIETGQGLINNNGVLENTGDLESDNELQQLELNGQSLSISNGNSVELPVANNLWQELNSTTIWTPNNAVINTGSTMLDDSLVSQLNLVSDGATDLLTIGNGDGNNWYIKKHYTTPDFGNSILDTCLLITTDEALSRKSAEYLPDDYTKLGLKIYGDGGLSTPNITFGDYRFGDYDESHPVTFYYGKKVEDQKYLTGTASDNWPNFHIDGSDNDIIIRTNRGLSIYGGIVMKSSNDKCWLIRIDDNGDFIKSETNCRE